MRDDGELDWRWPCALLFIFISYSTLLFYFLASACNNFYSEILARPDGMDRKPFLRSVQPSLASCHQFVDYYIIGKSIVSILNKNFKWTKENSAKDRKNQRKHVKLKHGALEQSLNSMVRPHLLIYSHQETQKEKCIAALAGSHWGYYSAKGMSQNLQLHNCAPNCNPFQKRLWQTHDFASGCVDVDFVEAGPCRKTRHCAHGANQWVDETGSNAGPHIPDWKHEARRRALHGWNMRKRVLSFRHAYWEVWEALLGIHFNLLLRLHGSQSVSRIKQNVMCSVYLSNAIPTACSSVSKAWTSGDSSFSVKWKAWEKDSRYNLKHSNQNRR